MKKFNFKILIPVIFLIAFLGGSSWVLKTKFDQVAQVKAYTAINNISTPKGVFLEAFNAIKTLYVDKTFNNQDITKWKNRYLNQIQTKDDAYVAIESMLESLNDPYTRFLPPSDFEEQDRNIDAKLFGIGVHIADIANKIIVVKVIEDTPAAEAGLKQGDIITTINNVSAKGMEIKDAAALVRGKAGTKVTLGILRDKKNISKVITRREINIKSVSSKILKENIGYIRIDSFISSETSIEMIQALKKIDSTNGIIIDVRSNHGGLLPNAIYIANMFINNGTIVSIVDRNGRREEINAEPNELVTNKPLVVLINGTSASASEILSGALKDHNRAILVGEKTFGKGCVQKIHKLPDNSGINITIAKYLTPNGTDINEKGIEPDYKVELTKKDFLADKDPQLDKAKQLLLSEISKKKNNSKLSLNN